MGYNKLTSLSANIKACLLYTSHARGEKVMAMMAGIVVKVGQDNASGKYVVLRHGNNQVSYCQLSRILVEIGRKVCPAEPVGITGSTGRSTGEHLHLSLIHI